ncbi:hypothetical protein M422DRAFT_42436 [Sphaerobolus stellatus SS14]|nr:hypothetical protein M422DRAFT_42436 [Sphaerobolus stellatus SS14]
MSILNIDVDLIQQGLDTQSSVVAALAFLLYDYSDFYLAKWWTKFSLDLAIPFESLRWTSLSNIRSNRSGIIEFLFRFPLLIEGFILGILMDFGDANITQNLSQFCTVFFWWEGLWGVLSVLLVDIILQSKIYAVYNRNNTLLLFLVPLFILVGAWTVGSLVKFMLENTNTDSLESLIEEFKFRNNGQFDLTPLKGCFSIGRSFPFWLWIAPLAFETLLCLLMVNKAWEIYKQDWRSPLLRGIVVDRRAFMLRSILYFLPIFSLLLGSCLLWSIENKRLNNLVQLTAPWVTAIPSALGSRLLLNIRKEVSKARSKSPSEVIVLRTIEST